MAGQCRQSQHGWTADTALSHPPKDALTPLQDWFQWHPMYPGTCPRKTIRPARRILRRGNGMFARPSALSAVLAAALLGPTAAHAQISDDLVKIGVLTDMN